MTIYVFSFLYSYINHCLDYHNVWNEQESVWIVHRSISAANVDQQTSGVAFRANWICKKHLQPITNIQAISIPWRVLSLTLPPHQDWEFAYLKQVIN